MSKSKQKHQQVQDPFLQDELDVYEAVLKLEEDYGKEILTENQKKKLLSAREHLSKLKTKKSTKVRLEEAGGDAEKVAEMMILAMKRVVETLLISEYEYCSLEEWQKKSPELKSKVINLFFYMVYEIREDVLREKLIEAFEGGAKNE